MPEKPLSALSTLSGGDPITKSKPNKPSPSDEQLRRFSDFAGTPDSKGMSSYLSKKGLIGADQLLTDHPDLSSRSGIINAQSNWKPNAMSLMLWRARQLGLKTPAEIKANRDAVMSYLPPRLKDAVKHPVFNQIHPNWWDTFDLLLKERYDSEKTSTPLSSLATSLAKK